MWIYDGEQWIEEGGNEKTIEPEESPRPEEMHVPELEVVQIPVPKPNYVPPFPLP